MIKVHQKNFDTMYSSVFLKLFCFHLESRGWVDSTLWPEGVIHQTCKQVFSAEMWFMPPGWAKSSRNLLPVVTPCSCLSPTAALTLYARHAGLLPGRRLHPGGTRSHGQVLISLRSRALGKIQMRFKKV